MSTPWIVVAVVGAFILGLALGVPVAVEVLKRRAKAAVADALAVTLPEPAPVPEKTLELPKLPKIPRPATQKAEFIITSAGEPEGDIVEGIRKEFSARPQLDRLAKAALVEAASLAHGVRSALSEENRAKIQYEVKRELIALRRTRKAEVKQALAEYRAKHRAPGAPDSGEGP